MLEQFQTVLVDVLCGRHVHRLNRLTRGVLDGTQHAALTRRYEQDRIAGTARTTGTADTVHIGLGVVRNVIVDHVGDALDVQTTGHDIGRHQNVQLTLLELVNGAFTQLLRDITVQRFTGMAACRQLAGQLFGCRLGTHECQQRIIRLDFQQTGHGVQLVQAGNQPVTLAYGGRRAGLGGNFHFHRLLQVTVRHTTDHIRHGGREQGDLTIVRALLDDPFDIIDEAHAQHFVGFVQYQSAQCGQVQLTLAHQVHDPARRTHDHLGATAQRADLGLIRRTAIDRQYMEFRHVLGVALARFGNLDRQFARRRQDQDLGRGIAGVEARDQRQRKRRRLAGTGLGLAQQVTAFQQRRNGCSLDRGWGLIADIIQRFEDRSSKAQLRKARQGFVFRHKIFRL